MHADMLAELAHLFFLEATDWGFYHTDRDRTYFLKCSRALAERALREANRVKR